MATFTESRGLSSIGGSLRDARIAAGHSLEQVADALDIRPAYIEALEAGGLGRVLGPAYVESMTVRYAMFLGLDPEELLVSVLQSAGANGNGDAPAHPALAPPPAIYGRRSLRPSRPGPLGPSEPAVDLSSASASPATPGMTSPVPAAHSVEPGVNAATPAARAAEPPRSAEPPRPARSRRRSDRAVPAAASRKRVVRVGVVVVLMLALVAVAVFGGLEIGLFSLLGGSGDTTVEQSGTLIAAASSAPDTAGADGAPAAGAAVSTTTSTVDASAAPVSPTDDDPPADGSGVVVATTTTVDPGQADAAGGASTTGGGSGTGGSTTGGGSAPATGAAGFTLRIDAGEEAWIEVRDAASDAALYVGAVAKGGSVDLEVEGPVNVVAGKPEVLTVKIDGRAVATPNSFRWSVTSAGVAARP